MLKDIYGMTQEENIFCAKRILVDSIYKQARLEGIAVTFASTHDILNNVNVEGLQPKDMSKVFCLRDGWQYLFQHLNDDLNLVFLEELHELIARFDVDFNKLGKFRDHDVLISGTDWRPPIPSTDSINELCDVLKLQGNASDTEKAIKTGLYLMRMQLFSDGNKRIGSFVINKILIEKGRGIFNVPVELDGTFKQMLVDYYESDNPEPLTNWVYENCLTGTTKALDSF